MKKVILNKPMLCGSYEAEHRKYVKIIEGSTTWLYVPERAEFIYCQTNDRTGFAGRTITFPLIDGGSVSLIGPWHTNAHAQFADTGVDLRDKHYTKGLIAGQRLSCWPYEFDDVIYYEEEPIIGTFNRIEEMCKKLVKGQGKALFYYSESFGGSTSGLCDIQDL